jgi:hypothetical protein
VAESSYTREQTAYTSDPSNSDHSDTETVATIGYATAKTGTPNSYSTIAPGDDTTTSISESTSAVSDDALGAPADNTASASDQNTTQAPLENSSSTPDDFTT